MTKAYIAGPVTGKRNYEEAFTNAAELLLANGFTPIDPTADGEIEGWTYRDYINRGLKLLMDCDVICMLPGWQSSLGATAELQYAKTVGMPKLFLHRSYGTLEFE